MISLASASLHGQVFCTLPSAISSCHVTSYLLGPRGHCLSDWQDFDSAQYSNNLRACRHRRITAWWIIRRPGRRERVSEEADEGQDQDKSFSFAVVSWCQNHRQQNPCLLAVPANLPVISPALHFYWKWFVFLITCHEHKDRSIKKKFRMTEEGLLLCICPQDGQRYFIKKKNKKNPPR